ncbi:unnamed protein product, partial [Brenthis ino]
MNPVRRSLFVYTKQVNLQKRFVKYIQGQEPEPKIREYFYYIDHQGMPIPATAGNLIETSQLRRRYYSAQVYAQTQVHSLFLSLSYSGGTTARHDRYF